MKAVHFGAGKIGRGFIADLLHDSGYEIVFADVSQPMIDELNQHHNYFIYVIEENHRKKEIDKVRALSTITQTDSIINEIIEADLVTTAVIVDNFVNIAEMLATGLKARLEAGRNKVNVIPCENAPYCGNMLTKAILDTKILTEAELNSIAAIPNTVVDRMVFNYEEDGRVGIECSQSFELDIEQTRLVNPTSEPIKGATYTDNISKFLDRKLFVINGGHTAAGYVGHLKGYEFIQDYWKIEENLKNSRDRMLQISTYVEKKYGFTNEEMVDYIDFALGRWLTPGIKDPISRISRAPIRKLAAKDRLVQPAVGLEELGLPNNLILEAIAAAFLYDEKGDEQAQEILGYVAENGIEKALTKYTGIASDSKIGKEIVTQYNKLKKVIS